MSQKLTPRQQRRAELNTMRANQPQPEEEYRRSRGLEDPEARDRDTARAGLVKGETACNRRACQAPLGDNRWWNQGTFAYYCQRCAGRINETAPTLCIQEHAPNENGVCKFCGGPESAATSRTTGCCQWVRKSWERKISQ